MSIRMRTNRAGVRRRGLTFLEIVVSVATLSLVASVIVGTISFFKSATMLERHRLNATEVANRVILNKLDDPTWRPAAMSRRYTMNGFRYAFNMQVDLFELGTEEATLHNLSEADINARITHLEQITVTVALDEPASTLSGVPLATLVRVRDPRRMDSARVLEWVTDVLSPATDEEEGDDSGPSGGGR